MADLPSEIIKVQKQASKRSVLLTGPSGTGKTYQYRTLVEGGRRGLYVDVEKKIPTIADLEPEMWPIHNLDMPLTPTDKQEMLAEGSSDLIKVFDYLRTADHPFDFVYFDSMMRYGKKLLHKLKHEDKLGGYDLWGFYGYKLGKALEVLVSLASVEQAKPVHVVATWGVKIGKDWRDRRLEQPIVDGKMVGPDIPYYFDDVIRLSREEDAETGDNQFYAYTGGTAEFSAKISSGVVEIPQKIEDPNLHRILLALEGKLTPNSKE
jgi:hypothetical protein